MHVGFLVKRRAILAARSGKPMLAAAAGYLQGTAFEFTVSPDGRTHV